MRFSMRHAAAVIAHGCAAMALVAALAMRATGLLGDEFTYTQMAADIAAWMADESSGAQALDKVIGTGWFMPGMGMAGSPLYLLSDAPSLRMLRLLALCMNLALLAVLVRLAWRSWGPWHGLALLVFPGLALGWHLAASGWWPEIPAGLLSTIALVACWRIGMAVVQGEVIGWRMLLLFELALAAGLYFRGPVLPLALGLHLVLIGLLTARLARRAANTFRIGAGLTLLAALLLPWSMAVSAKFDAPVLTTNNFALVLADGFAGPEKACFGPCQPGEDIWPAWRYSQEVAAETGESPLDVQRAMRDDALADLTPTSYLASLRDNFTRFLFDPMQRAQAYQGRMFGVPEQWRRPFVDLATAITLAVYVPFLLALFVANVLPFRASDPLRMQGILLKGATACVFLQPFLHKSSARYWAGFAPLMAWAAALLLAAWLARRAGPGLEQSEMPEWIDWVQRGYGAGFLLAGGLITIPWQ